MSHHCGSRSPYYVGRIAHNWRDNTGPGAGIKRLPMCPVELNSGQVGGIYVDGKYTVLPYTVASGEKRLISHQHPLGFRYLVFGTDRGGYYMDAYDPFNP